MRIEHFRAVVYKSTEEGILMAECIETGAMSSGRNIEEALKRMNSCHVGFLTNALENDYAPLSDRGSEDKIKELIKLGVDEPFTLIPSQIGKRYFSLIHCYDKTHLPHPRSENEK